jgi:hypothetical protein
VSGWRPKPSPRVEVVLLKGGNHHAHGCTVCGLRYADACQITDVNGRCMTCRTGQSRPKWDRDGDPRPCCRATSRQATKDERNRYRLGGPKPWWRCRTCARTHPFNPSTTTPDAPGTGPGR